MSQKIIDALKAMMILAAHDTYGEALVAKSWLEMSEKNQ